MFVELQRRKSCPGFNITRSCWGKYCMPEEAWDTSLRHVSVGFCFVEIWRMGLKLVRLPYVVLGTFKDSLQPLQLYVMER